EAFAVDLLTPARTWTAAGAPKAPERRMPALQRAVMFLSVVGPLVGMAGAGVLLWGRGVGPVDLAVIVLMYCVAGFGVTIGFHRLLTHRSFETIRPMRIL